jgi:hypothetical protein
MIGHLVQERNEAWDETNLLRQRVEELRSTMSTCMRSFMRSTMGLARMLLQKLQVWTSMTTKTSPQPHLPTMMTLLLMVVMVMSPTLTMARGVG